MKKILITIVIAATLIGCSDDDQKSYPPPTIGGSGNEVGTAQIWVTSGNESRLLSAQDHLSIIDNKETSYPSITINETEQMQEIEGFGAALTGSSAYVINNLSTAQKNSLLSDLFDVESGAGMSYLRLTIGASDFSLEDFTYDDMPQGQEDPNLDNFSIAHDEMHVIPVANDILSINPEVKFMGSPWSAPAWMKDNESLYGGKLEEQWYATYANYFVEYIQAFKNHGIPIDAITPQNEPLHTSGYPTMRMEAQEQANFIKNALGPAFEGANISTKIIAYDHNFDEAGYPMTVLGDGEANPYVSGSAFHAYAGDVSAMSQVHNAYPDKGLYFTEISGGEWSIDFSSNLRWYVQNILMGSTKNWSKNALFWNLALNENHGPTNNGCQDCRGVVTINSSGEIEKNEEYYAIAHFSKFVRPGAHRIGSSNFDDNSGLDGIAFQNPDGSKALIVLNETPTSKTFSVIMGENRFDYTLSSESVATITWE